MRRRNLCSTCHHRVRSAHRPASAAQASGPATAGLMGTADNEGLVHGHRQAQVRLVSAPTRSTRTAPGTSYLCASGAPPRRRSATCSATLTTEQVRPQPAAHALLRAHRVAAKVYEGRQVLRRGRQDRTERGHQGVRLGQPLRRRLHARAGIASSQAGFCPLQAKVRASSDAGHAGRRNGR